MKEGAFSVAGPMANPIERLCYNCGIIAHIDAGKTTTTERMLYYAGIIKRMGEVHNGNTVMDFLKAERERGITIASAAISFDWAGHQVNLIDTPGHVDFGVEVERSLRVLDGVVTVLDGVAGVEAQTEQVWRQASFYGIPKVVFVNKMDRDGADSEKCLGDLAALEAFPVPINVPLLPNAVFDLVADELVEFGSPNGSSITRRKVEMEEFSAKRMDLLETLAERDDVFLEKFLDAKNPLEIGRNVIVASLKRLTAAHSIVPVLFGAAYRNVGIQPLMDAIVQYLPDSRDKSLPLQECVCLAFKVTIHPQKGALVFVRVYSGTLTSQSLVFNSSKQVKERIMKLFVPSADDFTPVSFVAAGGIAVLMGLKETRTGDTLVANVSQSSLVLPGIGATNPVFVQSIEPEKLSDEQHLIECLKAVSMEDPSFHYSIDDEANQILIHGIGELHLEVVADRLFNEMKAKGSVGQMRIAYKETIKKGIQISLEEVKNEVFTQIILTIERGNAMDNCIEFSSTLRITPQIQENAQKGFQYALQRGNYLANDPIAFLQVKIAKLQTKPEAPLDLICSEAYKILSQLLSEAPKASFERIEPYFQLEAIVPTSSCGTIVSDLSKRGTLGMVNHNSNGTSSIKGKLPVSRSLGYSKWIRTVTGGKVSFSMNYSGYESVVEEAS